jgi:hypothetical protein
LTLHNTIPVGKDPDALVIDPGAEKLVVVNLDPSDDQGSVTVVQICCGPITPQKSIGDLIITIQNMINNGTLNKGQGNALSGKLYDALEMLGEGKNKTAVNQLVAFIDKVTDLMYDGVIPAEQGAAIIDATYAIIDEIEVNKDDKKSEPVYSNALEPEMPSESALVGIYPNPFGISTTINYSVASENNRPVKVWMKVYSITGQLVANLVNQRMTPGFYTCEWDGMTEDGRIVSEGTYIIRFMSGDVHHAEIITRLR